MPLAPGAIIEHDSGGRPLLGVVLNVDKSLRVATVTGTETLVAIRDVTFETGLTAPVDPPDSAGALQDVLEQLEALQATANLHETWQLLLAEGGPWRLDEIADLLVGGREPIHVLAAHQMVESTSVYFKKTLGRFAPRSKEQVDALLRQEAAELAAQDAQSRFVALVRGLAEAGLDRAETQKRLSIALEDPEHRKRVDLLAGFAVQGSDFGRSGPATALLGKVVGSGLGELKLGGKGHVLAFDVLVACGHFHPHENLSVLRFGLEAVPDDGFAASAEALSAGLSWLGLRELGDLDLAGRVDRTDLRLFTVDEPTTRDIDDGLSISALGDGRFEVGIHIADPAEVVPLDHELDLEARRRATSVYLPEGAIPMFPRSLSERAMSLVPGELRPALSFLVVFGADGQQESQRIELSWVCSSRRMSYLEVNQILEGAEDPLSEDLASIVGIARRRCEKRLADGAVIFDIPEPKIRVERDETGEPVGVGSRPLLPTAARLLVGEMMVLAGEVAGEYCQRHGLPVVYRTQPAPGDAAARAKLCMGRSHPLTDSWSLRRLMKRGELMPEPKPHFGLGLDVYVQVTSPIRRYADLICHRQLRAHLRGEALPMGADKVSGLISELQSLSRSASIAERESRRYWTLVYLSKKVGEEMAATVVGHSDERKKRLVVWLDEVGLFIQVPSIGGVVPGGEARVRVVKVHPRRDLLVVRAVEPASAGGYTPSLGEQERS